MTSHQICRKKIKAALYNRLHTDDLTADQVEDLEFLIIRL